MIGVAGGYFAWLVLTHFISDWIFQSAHEAMNKHHDAKIRTRHCVIYAVLFLPVLFLFGMSWLQILLSLAFLFLTHWLEDTYYLPVLWMKYARRPSAFDGLNKHFTWKLDNADKMAFRSAIMDPINLILMIVVDQLVHLVCLLPIVWMMCK